MPQGDAQTCTGVSVKRQARGAKKEVVVADLCEADQLQFPELASMLEVAHMLVHHSAHLHMGNHLFIS